MMGSTGGIGTGGTIKSIVPDYQIAPPRSEISTFENVMNFLDGGRAVSHNGSGFLVDKNGFATGFAPVGGLGALDLVGPKGGFNAVGAFKKALSPFKSSNLTNVGRAVTKHPEYFGFNSTEALMKVYRSPQALNNLGASTLKEILRKGTRTTGAGGRYPNGWVTYTLSNGNAASWGLDGTFIGFRGIK